MKKPKKLTLAVIGILALFILLLVWWAIRANAKTGGQAASAPPQTSMVDSLSSCAELAEPQSTVSQAESNSENNYENESEHSATASVSSSVSLPATSNVPSNDPPPVFETAQLPSSGQTVYPNLSTIRQPTEDVFGVDLPMAQVLYQQHITGNYEDIAYTFDSQEKAYAFLDKFSSVCLEDCGLTVYCKYITTSSGSATMHISPISIREYQSLHNLELKIQSIVGQQATQLDVVDRITDWCVANCTYDYTYQINSAAGVLEQRTGTCQAYTDLLCHTCDLYGMQCQRISNDSHTHMWNRVNIGGTWYYTDITWSVCYGYNAYPPTTDLWDDHQY